MLAVARALICATALDDKYIKIFRFFPQIHGIYINGTVLVNTEKCSLIYGFFLTVYSARETSLPSARETFARRRQRPASLSVDTQISYAHVNYALWGTEKIHMCGIHTLPYGEKISSAQMT